MKHCHSDRTTTAIFSNVSLLESSVPTCSEVLCPGLVVVARDVGEATVVTMQGSGFNVVSSTDSALMNWGCSNT